MEYNETTLKALRESIEHWERLSSGNSKSDELLSYSDCSLCRSFYENIFCEGCPVSEASGFDCCQYTPYTDVADFMNDAFPTPKQEIKNSPEFQRLVKQELLFLKSLWPAMDSNNK